MTTIVFENAALADAVKKAAQVAPTKGAAFDKAHGILFEVNPGEDLPVAIRATDQNVFYTEWVSVLEVDGPPTVLRIPSAQLARVAAALPMGPGKTCKFEQKDNKVFITSGRMRCTINNIDHEKYPSWEVFDPDDMCAVPRFGSLLNHVSWAAGKDMPPLTGIHLDGEVMVATDRYKVAMVPCKIDSLKEPVTIPNTMLTSIIKDLAEVKIGMDGGTLHIMPDEYTQIKVVTYGEKYVDFKRVQRRDFQNEVAFDKTEMIDLISRCSAIGVQDRLPSIRFWIGNEEIAAMMENAEIGRLGDFIDLPGQAVHDRAEFKYTPDWVMGALAAAPNDQIKLHYDSISNAKIKFFYIDGGAGYEAWVVARSEKEA